MRIAVLLPDTMHTGVWYYAKNLYRRLKAGWIPVSTPIGFFSFPQYLLEILRLNVDVFHIQLEPRFFKRLPEQVMLPLLALSIRLKKSKLIVTLHAVLHPDDLSLVLKDVIDGYFTSFSKRIAWGMYLLITRIVLRFANKIIVHNVMTKKYVEHLFGTDISRKIEVIPHGVFLFRRKVPEKEELNLLYFGFLKNTRDLFTVIEAFKRLGDPRARLYLLIMLSKERQYSKLFQKNFSLLNEISKKDNKITLIIDPKEEIIQEVLLKTHIGILPYREKTFESSGVAWRYAGMGIPFVGTRVPKLISDFSFPCNKLLLHDFSSDTLALAIKLLLTDGELYNNVSRMLFEKASRNAWDTVAEHYLRVFREALSYE